jgi:hypothetical protein
MTWCCDYEIKRCQNFFLHGKHLIFGEFILRDSEKLPDLWWVDFFIFGGNQNSRNTKQMKLAFLDFDLAQILVNNKSSNIKTFWLQSELPVYVDDPLK